MPSLPAKTARCRRRLSGQECFYQAITVGLGYIMRVVHLTRAFRSRFRRATRSWAYFIPHVCRPKCEARWNVGGEPVELYHCLPHSSDVSWLQRTIQPRESVLVTSHRPTVISAWHEDKETTRTSKPAPGVYKRYAVVIPKHLRGKLASWSKANLAFALMMASHRITESGAVIISTRVRKSLTFTGFIPVREVEQRHVPLGDQCVIIRIYESF
ncbi:hypothetical protein C8R44DRAFT_724229 [Mycena epipterygia]|nr:hypothetical protein C8R44DRAFT_724229 [Mycena epipterygia]